MGVHAALLEVAFAHYDPRRRTESSVGRRYLTENGVPPMFAVRDQDRNGTEIVESA
jgi:hypothetical protein